MTSGSRGEQVWATRRRVLTAARHLFTRRGYVGSTIDAIASFAQVSPQTVYNVVGAKAAVLKAVYDLALAGGEGAGGEGAGGEGADRAAPVTDRAALAAGDPRECLRLYARMSREIFERAGPLTTVVFVQGAGRDPDVRAFADRIESERAAGTAGISAHIATRFGLRAGLSVAEAADVLWALTAPELVDRFIRRCGWSLDQYESWLARTLVEALLGA